MSKISDFAKEYLFGLGETKNFYKRERAFFEEHELDSNLLKQLISRSKLEEFRVLFKGRIAPNLISLAGISLAIFDNPNWLYTTILGEGMRYWNYRDYGSRSKSYFEMQKYNTPYVKDGVVMPPKSNSQGEEQQSSEF